MSTMIDRLTEAFPLHVQRILEEAYRQDGEEWIGENLNNLSISAGAFLATAFNWRESEEGFYYWAALCEGD